MTTFHLYLLLQLPKIGEFISLTAFFTSVAFILIIIARTVLEANDENVPPTLTTHRPFLGCVCRLRHRPCHDHSKPTHHVRSDRMEHG